ncbi:MAG: hypothetical protein KGK10_03500 [Rhodospirillales bacterium]|nr:hypothetical protein [Rhodospirillales bacterium]
MKRPPDVVFWLDEAPSSSVTIGLAFQLLAIQSVLFVLPAAVAATITTDTAQATRFLCLSILALAAWQALQLLTRGPVGSGYPVAAVPSSALLSAYVLTGQTGGGFGGIAAMVILTGLAAVALTFIMRRLRLFLPNEVAGVVVILTGVELVWLATEQLGLDGGAPQAGPSTVFIVVGSLLVMVAVALSGTRAAPFNVVIGAIAGVAAAVLLRHGPHHAAAMLASRPWLAAPEPWLPDFHAVSTQAVLAYALGLVAIEAKATGTLVVAQRAADASWTRPDAPPLRRGLLANGLGILCAGLVGGAAPNPATAALGLSIATGTLARRIVWFNIVLLVLVGLCPKLAALAVLTPASVKAAMLLYVAGFLMAQGCQLVTARLLDRRRTVIVALGLSAGILVAIAPRPFRAVVPALASPLSFGAIVAFLANLATLPLVRARAEQAFALHETAGREASDWIANVAAGWGLKPRTAQSASNAVDEMIQLLLMRKTPRVLLAATRAEDRIDVRVAWEGAPLPAPAMTPRAEDLLESSEGLERFAMWMATRESQGFSQTHTPRGSEARLIFED